MNIPNFQPHSFETELRHDSCFRRSLVLVLLIMLFHTPVYSQNVSIRGHISGLPENTSAWIRVYSDEKEIANTTTDSEHFVVEIPTDAQQILVRIDSLNPSTQRGFHPFIEDNIVLSEGPRVNALVHRPDFGHNRLELFMLASNYEKALLLDMKGGDDIKIEDMISRGISGGLNVRDSIVFRYGNMLKNLKRVDKHSEQRLSNAVKFYDDVIDTESAD